MSYTLSNIVEWLPNQGWDSRIHIAANGDLVNVFVVTTQRYVILVDTLLNPATAAQLVEHIQPELSQRRLLVINTHADWDHAWGNQLFAGANPIFPAPVIAQANGIAHHRHPQTAAFLARMRSERPDIFGDVTITDPTLTFTDELWIDGGDLTLHLFATPGHTADHIAIFIPEIRTLLAGDAAEIPFPFVYRAGHLPTLRHSLHRMAALLPEVALYCHAPVDAGPQLLRDNLAYYEAIEATCRDAIAHGIEVNRIADEELVDTLHCRFNEVTPSTGAWAEIQPEEYTERHAQQLRLMCAWIQGKEFAISEG